MCSPGKLKLVWSLSMRRNLIHIATRSTERHEQLSDAFVGGPPSSLSRSQPLATAMTLLLVYEQLPPTSLCSRKTGWSVNKRAFRGSLNCKVLSAIQTCYGPKHVAEQWLEIYRHSLATFGTLRAVLSKLVCFSERACCYLTLEDKIAFSSENK